MRLTLIIITIFTLFYSSIVVLAQANSAYEVEVLVAKKKDTKEVDSTIDFQKEKFQIKSDKKGKYDREFYYKDLKKVQYSYTKKPIFNENSPNWARSIFAIFVLSEIFQKPRTHWMTIMTDEDFVILKLERDNHKQIKLEFEVHKVKVETVTESSALKEN